MLISASSDFITLCREQISLLTQRLGASLSVVYLTQELANTPTSEAQLVPVVVYPETARLNYGDDLVENTANQQIQFTNISNISNITNISNISKILDLPDQQQKLLTASSASNPPSQNSEYTNTPLPNLEHEYIFSSNQIVLPLIYEGLMMGLLVTGREDRPWNQSEEEEIQSIAKTLAIACILDQRRAWLEQQLHQQQILQQQQRDLFDNLLHQFRNPLTAIRTFGKLLLKRLRVADPNRDVGTSIVRESDRLKELLQQFDQVIDLTDGDLTPIPLPGSKIIVQSTVEKPANPPLLLPGTEENTIDCHLQDLLAPLLISAQAIAQERNLELTADISENLPAVKVNIKALTEVLSNIIDNALKYTPARGIICIQTGLQKANFQGIAISDTGPGIPPQDLEHLGERHYRGVQAQTEIPGTGLGLAIAKQLIAQMQGEIEVFSPALNSNITSPKHPGTTFIIWLPEVVRGS